MSRKAVFCIANSRRQADQIVNHLKTESFTRNEISALFTDQGATRDLAHDNNKKAPKSAVAGAGSSGVIGGGMAWLGTSDTTGFAAAGSSIAAGPIAAALSDVAESGIATGLIRLGIPATEAKSYEGKVKDGNILLVVHTDDPGDIARVKDIFKQAGAHDICTADAAAPANLALV